MKPFRHKPILVTAAFVVLSNVAVFANETSESAADTSPGVVVKVKKTIERSAKAVGHGIERGVSATARGIKRGATATSNAVHSIAKKADGPSNEPPSSDKAHGE